MGLITNFSILLLTVSSAFIVLKVFQTDPVPIVEDEYWGPKSEQGKKEDPSIRPFKIDISATTVDDLKGRLKREFDSNRLVPPLEGIGFEYGFNSKFLKTVGQHWLSKYDWKVREKLLNKYPHFKTKIGGLDIHFQHVKSKSKNGVAPRPLLLIHGWPGSIIEFQKIIPLLSEPKNSKYNYELVIPSLPGFGFSDAAARRGLSPLEMGNIFKRLMKRLGHEKFFVSGANWGVVVITDMATVYPENVIAAQLTTCTNILSGLTHFRYILATLFPSFLMTPDEAKVVVPYSDLLWNSAREFGYSGFHATKPDTVGTALTHSPLGLAAYLLDKFSTWTNKKKINREDGGILENFTMDELLDNVMIYWVTGSITSAVRIYAEMLDPAKKHKLDRVPTDVPISCLYMPNDLTIEPEFALKDKYTNIQRYSIASKGGHFGAFEEPELVAEDAITHFDKY